MDVIGLSYMHLNINQIPVATIVSIQHAGVVYGYILVPITVNSDRGAVVNCRMFYYHDARYEIRHVMFLSLFHMYTFFSRDSIVVSYQCCQ